MHAALESDHGVPRVLDVGLCVTDDRRVLDHSVVVGVHGAKYLVYLAKEHLHQIPKVRAAVHNHPATGEALDPPPLGCRLGIVERLVGDHLHVHQAHIADQASLV